MLSSTLNGASLLHVAIILDGNGRWACARGRARVAGHRAGVEAVRRVVEAAPALGIGTLSLYAFSADNWKRPAAEVACLMEILRWYLRNETARCVERGVRIGVIGRRDRLDPAIVRAIEEAERSTRAGRGLYLRLAIDYSARDAILRASSLRPSADPTDREAFARRIAVAQGETSPAPDVDLLIRSGGEKRLSDFLLWECAYAELLFVPVPWPDFAPSDLEGAIADFGSRERRFGALPGREAGERALRPRPSRAARTRP